MNFNIIFIIFTIVISDVHCESVTVLGIQKSLALQVLKSTINSTKNTIISVLPLQFSFCKLASIARSGAKDELLKAVGLPNNKMVDSFYSKFRNTFEQQSRIALTYFNKIYVNYSDDIDENFLANSSTRYGVSVDRVSFKYPKSAAAFINKKVSSATYRRVEDIVQAADIDSHSSMLLVTAAHFKPTWDTPFDYSLTKARIFRHLGNKLSNIPMMTKVGTFYYYDARDYQVLGMGAMGMFMMFVKPTFVNLERVFTKLQADPDLLINAVSLMQQKEIKVVMPRMKIKSEHDLIGYLKEIGIKEILNSSSTGLNSIMKQGINTSNIFINKVKQKLVLEVDEFGVYKNIYLRNENSRPQLPYIEEFVLDSPFYFTINLGLTIYDNVEDGPASPPQTETYELLNGVFYGPE